MGGMSSTGGGGSHSDAINMHRVPDGLVLGDLTFAHGPRESHQYATMLLDQPWGEIEESVRIFPPCEVKETVFRHGTAVTVFVKNANKAWRRKRVGIYDIWPSAGFIAWDDTNKEYAWHEVGTIDVPDAVDPRLSESTRVPLATPRARGRRRRRTFTEWWTSKARSNDLPDVLRSKGTG